MKTMDEKIRAAETILGALLGAKDAQKKIPSALERACRGWAAAEQEEVLVLAEHLSFTRGLASHMATDPFDHGDLQYFATLFAHDTFVGEEIKGYLGRRRPFTDSERERFFEETMTDPHPWLAGAEPTDEERKNVPDWWFER